MRRIQALTISLIAVAVTAQTATAATSPTNPLTLLLPTCSLPAFNAPKTDANTTGDDDRWTSCIQVKTTMANPPTVGQASELTAEIIPDEGTSGLSIVSVELPRGIALVSAPQGFQASAVPSTKTDGTVATTVNGRITLAAGQSARLIFSVKPTAAGAGSIRVVATDPSKRSVGGQSSIHLTYGATSQASHFGIDVPEVLAAKKLPTTVKPRGFKAALQARAATPVAGDNLPNRRTSRRAHGAGTMCVKGSFNYSDHNGAWHPSPNLEVKVYDDNVGSDTQLASGVTGGDGSFNFCFSSSGTGFLEGNNADPYVVIKTQVTLWKVIKSNGNPYAWETSHLSNASAATHDFGSMTTGDSNTMRSLALYDEINRAYWSIPGCWDDHTTCEQKVAKWWPDYSPWPYASGNTFNIPGPGPDSPVVVLHELGHTVMYDAYEHNWPSGTCPNPHYVNRNEDQGCAFSEGWPNWFAGHVLQNEQLGWWDAPGDNNLLGSAPSNTKLEDGWWFDGDYLGDTVESRIAEALWDIEDSATGGTDTYWDRTSGGFASLWDTFQRHNDTDNFRDFWNQRQSDGYDTTSQNVLSTLYGATIDLYGAFRDTLSTGVTYTRPTPPQFATGAQDTGDDHNWRSTMTAGRCRIFTVTPQGGRLIRMKIFSNSSLTTQIADTGLVSSATSLTVPALGSATVYPKVIRGNGTKDNTYTLRAVNCGLLGSKFPLVFSAAGLMSAFEIAPAGATRSVTVTPTTRGTVRATADVKLVLQKLSGEANTTQQGIETLGTADSGGAGRPESITIPAIQTQGNFVLQVITKSGDGNFSLNLR